MRFYSWLAVLPLPFVFAMAQAASTVSLPPWMCGGDVIFSSGFEADGVPHAPSNGSGGAYPGDQTRVITVAGAGMHGMFLYIPTAYTPTRAWPLMLVMHGTAGAGNATNAARIVRDDWSSIAEAGGFIVMSPIASGATGSWAPDVDIPAISAGLADMAMRYNIELSRVDMWGYSAGGHLAHALALNNTDYFAAYGVSAGALTQYACTDDGSIPPSCSALLDGAHPKIPVDIHLGYSDPLYLYYGAGGDPVRFEAGGWVAEQDLFYRPFNGGHTYTVAQLGEIWANICPFALGP